MYFSCTFFLNSDCKKVLNQCIIFIYALIFFTLVSKEKMIRSRSNCEEEGEEEWREGFGSVLESLIKMGKALVFGSGPNLGCFNLSSFPFLPIFMVLLMTLHVLSKECNRYDMMMFEIMI